MLSNSFTQIYILFQLGFHIGPPKMHRGFHIGIPERAQMLCLSLNEDGLLTPCDFFLPINFFLVHAFLAFFLKLDFKYKKMHGR